MDRSSGKRGSGGSVTPRKIYSSTAFKEAATEGNQSAQFCNRIGCSGRMKFNQNARIGISDKSRYSKPSFCSSNGNEGARKSSGSNSVMVTAQRSCLDSKRKMFSQVKPDPMENSLSTESQAVSSPSNLNRYQSESTTTIREVNITEAGSSSASASVSPRKTFRSKSGLHNQNTSAASSAPSVSKNSALDTFSRINRSSCGLRCNSISDAIPPSCSRLESECVRKNFIKKISLEGESSSSNRGREIMASPSIDIHTSPVVDGSGSSSTSNRRSTNVNARTRFSSRQDGIKSLSVREPSVSFSRNDYEIPSNIGDGSSLQQSSLGGLRSYRNSSNNSENSSSRTSFPAAESGSTHLMNRDVLRRFNMDGIAEALLALERIELDEELTHEQILALETSLFFSGLNLYDQHRDMRMDIDNMSYEELLALEERMGSVSTALSEEALSKCMKRSIYEATLSKEELTGSRDNGDGIKCSICQEEYVNGDEIGNLVECGHGYHATCINQWLQQKNWCPVCKASAAPSQPSPSS